jgi:gliding motility-associated-like protein
LILTVNPIVTSTTNTTICTNQLPYTWNGQNITAAGTYTTNLTSASGCDSIATLNLTVNATLTSTTNTTICTNQLKYTWNGQDITAAGTYTANLISASGCDSIATLILTVNSAATSTTNTTICNNQLPYAWNGQNITTAGTYTANLTSAIGCDSIATLILTVNSTVTSTNNATICNNQLPYTWNGQNITAAGTYTANLTNASGCDSIATLVLTISQPTQGIRYPAATASANVPLQLSARNLGIGFNYQWNPVVGLNNYSIYNPIFNYDRQTEYTINITSNTGCTATDTLLVRILAPGPTIASALYVPNAWSPNGDGHNDKLTPITVNIIELKYFRVFNRWGQLLFETNILKTGWDGIYNGQPQVSDTYTWTAEAIGVDGKTYKSSGNAVLIR